MFDDTRFAWLSGIAAVSGTDGGRRHESIPAQLPCEADNADCGEMPHQGRVYDDADESGMHERVRRRLMQDIARDSTTRHLTARADARLWKPFLPGIERQVLYEAPDTMSYLLRFAAGAILPAHHHPTDEECLVLSGVLAIGTELELHEGDFHLGHANLPHAAIHSMTGAVIYLRGATPRADMMI